MAINEDERQRQVRQHLDAIRALEAAAAVGKSGASWPPDGFYMLWHVVIGMMIGAVGALVSLGANFVGAPLFGERPLQLIRVYLTFPMGERALQADEGVLLAVGSLLYLITGAAYGVLFHLMMRLGFRNASGGKRFLVATVFGLVLWIVNFYLLLSWLQPMLLGGDWIVRLVPWWVAALTHVAFAWTMLLGESWGKFEAYRGGRG